MLGQDDFPPHTTFLSARTHTLREGSGHLKNEKGKGLTQWPMHPSELLAPIHVWEMRVEPFPVQENILSPAAFNYAAASLIIPDVPKGSASLGISVILGDNCWKGFQLPSLLLCTSPFFLEDSASRLKSRTNVSWWISHYIFVLMKSYLYIFIKTHRLNQMFILIHILPKEYTLDCNIYKYSPYQCCCSWSFVKKGKTWCGIDWNVGLWGFHFMLAGGGGCCWGGKSAGGQKDLFQIPSCTQGSHN